MTAPLPDNVDIVRVRGYWFDQDGGGNQQTVTFEPLISNITDAAAFSYIKTETVTVTPDSDTAYFFHDLIASNDPDLTPFAWKVTLQGQPSFTIAVDYNASVVDVGSGVHMKAVWLVDAATTDPPPDPINAYYTSDQTNAAIAEALDGFEVTSAVTSVAGRTGDVVLVEGDISGLVADLAAKVAKSTFTTKGDLLAASSSATPVRVGVGSNNQVLTADSSQTAGVKWADPTGGSGAVDSVTAGDSTVTIGGTASDPTVAVNAIAESKVTNLVSDLAGKQPLDSDLTAFAALAPSNDDVVQRKAGVWTNRTIAQLSADLGLAAGYQPLNTNLTAIAGTTATTNNILMSVGSAWASRTPSQVKTALAIAESDVTNLTTDLAAKVDKTTFTTKGDIVAATGSGAISRLGVGSNNQVLTADSSAATGVKWAAAGGGSVTSVSNLDGTLTVTGTSTDPVVSISAVVIANTAPLGSPTFSGTATFQRVVGTPVVLTDAATIAVDASLGNLFRVTLGGNRTMGVPSTPSDGQEVLFEIIQDGTGSRTVTWASGAGGYQFDVPTPILNTTAGARDFVAFAYNATANKWCFASAPSGLTDLSAADATIVIAGTDTSPTVAVGAIAESQVTNLVSDLAAKQPLDADLTAIAGLSPTANDALQYKSGAWTNRSMAQLGTDLALSTTYQGLDSDLTAIAGLTPSANDTLQYKSGAWTNRTPAQLATDMSLSSTYQPLDSDLTTIAGLTATTDNFMVANASAWASRTPTQAKASLAITESDVSGLVSDLAAKQPLDSDLTTIAGLTATTDNIIQSSGGAWASRTPTQVKAVLAITESDVTGLVSDLAGKQASNSNLTTIAALTPTTDNFLGGSGGAWANRTPSQVKTSLGITESDVSGLVSDLAAKQPLDSDLTAFAALSPADGTYVKRASGAWTASSIAAGDIGSGTVASARLPLVASTPYTITYSTTITMDPTLGNNAQMTATGPSTMGISTTGALNGQQILLEVLASLAQRTITFTGINILPGLSSVNAVTSGKVGFFAMRYSSLDSSWHLMSSGISS